MESYGSYFKLKESILVYRKQRILDIFCVEDAISLDK